MKTMKTMTNFDPNDDGVSHINIYTKGRTKLGRLLSHMSDLHVEIDNEHFHCLEGYWHFLRTGSIHTRFKILNGFEAKRYAKTVPTVWNKDFRTEFLKGIALRLEQNSVLINLLNETNLRLVQYHHHNGKVTVPKDTEWYIYPYLKYQSNMEHSNENNVSPKHLYIPR